MFKKIILFSFCILLFACTNKEAVHIPATILPKDKMAALMLDIHLLEATMNTNIMKTEFLPAAPLHTDIFKKNGVSKKQFDDSFDFYAKHPELFSEVYQVVLDDLSKMQAEVMNKK